MANIVDPVEMLMKTTSSLLLPTSLVPTSSSPGATHSVAPIPTVVPNPPEFQDVGATGKRTLWVVFVVMVLASIIFTGLAWKVPVQKRLYHVITTSITIIAALSYFAMATGHGVNYNHIHTHNKHLGGGKEPQDIYRQVFYARYIDWSLTTPLLLLDLLLLAGANGATIVMAVGADLIMILTGLFAAYGSEQTSQKWGWYTFGCIAYLVVVWHLVLNGRASALSKGSSVSKFYTSITGFTLILWTAYPIVWGIADGGRHVSVDGEIIAYAILDILAKPVFGLWLLITHSRVPETNIELGGFWSQGLGGEGRIRIGDDDDGA